MKSGAIVAKAFFSSIVSSMLTALPLIHIAAASSAAVAAEHTVEIRNSKFQPQVVQIKVGDSVRWINKEKRTSHSVLFPGNPSLESDRLLPDESWVRRFDRPEAFSYSCGPHPEMLGIIEVTE